MAAAFHRYGTVSLGHALQVMGSIGADDVAPQFLFNHLVTPPRFLRPASERAATAPTEDEGETQALLAEEALEDTAALPSELGRSGFDVVPPEEHATHAHGLGTQTAESQARV